MTSDLAVGPVCFSHVPAGYTVPQWTLIWQKTSWMCISPSKACLVLLICRYLPQHEPRRLLTIPRLTELSSYQKQRVPKIDWRQPLWICEALLDLWCLLDSLSCLGARARIIWGSIYSRVYSLQATPTTPTHFHHYLPACSTQVAAKWGLLPTAWANNSCTKGELKV